ncbi:MAG: hydrogenase small subunit [Blastocatellia bacterium]
MQSAKPNPTNATPIHKIINKPVINVPGYCPPIADVMTGVVTHLLVFGKLPELTVAGVPKEFYGRRVHDTLPAALLRRGLVLWKPGMMSEAARKGYCPYKMGCRGPTTYNACAVTKWNGGVSYPVQSGHGCIGCSEAGFWDNGPFYQHLAGFPGFGIETTADTIGTVAGVATLVGVAAHAVMTPMRKRKLIAELNGEAGADEPEETPTKSDKGGK